MAEIKIRQVEGMRSVRIFLENETVQAESGALASMGGDIEMIARIPSPLTAIRAVISDQSIIRPKYTGSGILNLDPSLNGYYVFEVPEGEGWVLERGSYWASEGSIKLRLVRERVMTSLWAGEGFIYYQIRLGGHGKVVLKAKGPVQEIKLKNEILKVDGRLVIARTEGISYKFKRPTKSWLGSRLCGEGRLRIFEGSGTLLVSRQPFWNRRLLKAVDH